MILQAALLLVASTVVLGSEMSQADADAEAEAFGYDQPCLFWSGNRAKGTLYEVGNFRGDQATAMIGPMKENFKSYKLAPGFTLVVCDEEYLKGTCETMPNSMGNLPRHFRRNVHSFDCIRN